MVALGLTLALVLTAGAAVGLRLLGESGSARPLPTSFDSLVVEANPSNPGTPQPPSPPPPTAADAPIAAAPERFVGQAAKCSQPAPPRATGTQSGTFAVIIGINDYPGAAHDLRSAVPDAEDVNRALGALGVPPGNRLVISDGQATGRAIAAAADWLAARAGPDATAVFFFAGHVRKLAGATEAMVGADGCTVTDAQLAGRLGAVKARRMWVAMAACYGGGFTEVLRPGVVLTGAAAAGERAYENSAFNRSYMVEYMVRQAIVEGRASESVQAAFGYARDSLARDFPDRIPVQFDRAGGPIDLRQPGFTPPPRPSPAPAPAAQPSPPPPESDPGSSGPTTTTTTTPPPTTPCSLTRYVKCPGS